MTNIWLRGVNTWKSKITMMKYYAHILSFWDNKLIFSKEKTKKVQFFYVHNCVVFMDALNVVAKTFIVNIPCTSPITFSNGKFNFDTRKRVQLKMAEERDQLLCWPTITGYQCSMSRHTWSNFYNWCYIICVWKPYRTESNCLSFYDTKVFLHPNDSSL